MDNLDQHIQLNKQFIPKCRRDDSHFSLDACLHVLHLRSFAWLRLYSLLFIGKSFEFVCECSHIHSNYFVSLHTNSNLRGKLISHKRKIFLSPHLNKGPGLGHVLDCFVKNHKIKAKIFLFINCKCFLYHSQITNDSKFANISWFLSNSDHPLKKI